MSLTLTSPPPLQSIPRLARAIQSCLWDAGAEAFDGTTPVKVWKCRGQSGVWKYTIERVEGIVCQVSRFNGDIVDTTPSTHYYSLHGFGNISPRIRGGSPKAAP